MENAFSTSHRDLKTVPFLTIVELYLEYYATEQTNTARAKRIDLDHFTRFLARRSGYARPGKLTLNDWTPEAVNEFLEDRMLRGEAPATIARRLATLKHLGHVLSERHKTFTNPALKVKTVRAQPKKPESLSQNEIVAVKQKASNRVTEKDSFNRVRNEILFALLLDTGIRAEEVRLLRRDQLDESLSWIRNIRTKGRRYRNVPISESLKPALEFYLNARACQLAKHYPNLSPLEDAAHPLFISNYNAEPGTPDSFRMGAKSIWRAINEFSTDTSLHPHLLRHSFASELMATSNNIKLVARTLGHTDTRITRRYEVAPEKKMKSK